jgi:DNA-binding NtrC family response regulator
MARLVLYSHDPKLLPLLTSALKPTFNLSLESDEKRLRQAAANETADVLVLDFDRNHSTFEQQIAFLSEFDKSRVPIIVMTDDLRRSTTTEFLLHGAYDCVGKPPSLPEFNVVLRRACEHTSLERELERMRSVENSLHCDQLVGSSGRSQIVYNLVRRVANLSATVLIIGESGTGKELVASAIHNLGNRSKHPFIPVSCGAIPESLIEAELFGHEKGAFTGTNGSRAGYLERAGEGTLLLDEIGELSLNTQVKLLRVLQQKEFCRLGSSNPIPLRARILLATHRNLEKMVQEGTFRTDLYFRVNVMQIKVPPLRERTEDIPALAAHFLRKYSKEYDKPVNDIRPHAMELLVAYDWPGNVRELENVIQGAVILTDGDSIAASDLPEHLQLEEDPSDDLDETAAATFGELLNQFKISLAAKAVAECHGNKTLAARKLGVSRAYLHRLLRKLPDSIESVA